VAEYQTEQRKTLVDFMKKNRESSFTIEELVIRMQSDLASGSVPGKSTVYRLMQKIVSEGTVKRFVKGNSRQFVYQITGCEHFDKHLHLKCVECGKLFHMSNQLSDDVFKQIFADSNFSIDEEQTVLFGKCAECRKGKSW